MNEKPVSMEEALAQILSELRAIRSVVAPRSIEECLREANASLDRSMDALGNRMNTAVSEAIRRGWGRSGGVS